MNSNVENDSQTNGAVVAIAWVLAIFTVGYMLPWAIAETRGKSNSGAVGLINFLLGWTLIGWIIALVMACGSHQVVGPNAARFMAPQAFAPAANQMPEAAWLDDGTGQLRWWDGTAWTEHVQPPNAAPPAAV